MKFIMVSKQVWASAAFVCITIGLLLSSGCVASSASANTSDQAISDAASDEVSVPAAASADTVQPVDRTILPPDILGEEEGNDDKATRLKIYELERDLGTIEYGDSATHTFRYKNIGDKDFVIEQYVVGCGCTQISEPKKRIAPGETGEITLQFNSKEKEGPGDYNSDAMIIGNVVPDGFVEFKIKVKVVAKGNQE